MKKWIIAIVTIIVLSFGGLLIHGKTKSTSPTSSNTSTSDQTRSQSNPAGVLDYNSRGLTSVGPSVYNQTTATTLILSNNSIRNLPSQMGKMTNLQVLKIDHNVLDGSLIAEVRLMPLIDLDVSYNNMTGMPAEIGKLNKLVNLNYSYNKIIGLPNELANLKNNLKTFNLAGNPLSRNTIDKLKTELPNTTIIF